MIHMPLQSSSARVTIPFAELKLRVLITGKYPIIFYFIVHFFCFYFVWQILKYTVKNSDDTISEVDALDGGAVWIPGRVYMKRLDAIYGHNVMEAVSFEVHILKKYVYNLWLKTDCYACHQKRLPRVGYLREKICVYDMLYNKCILHRTKITGVVSGPLKFTSLQPNIRVQIN